MPKRKAPNPPETPAIRPMIEPQAREDQMIALAEQLAQQQMLDGTASSSVICHYLKLGSSKNKLELANLQMQNELMRVKTEAIQAQQAQEDLYLRAIQAFMGYAGHDDYPMPDLNAPDFGFGPPMPLPMMSGV